VEIEDYGPRRLDGALSYFAAYAYVSISYPLIFSRPTTDRMLNLGKGVA
jgi:hypothetical protein